MEATITSKGQATIPKAVRDFLHLEPGDKVKFFIHPNGHVAMLPKVPTSALKGIVKHHRTAPLSVEQMDEAVTAGVTAEYMGTEPLSAWTRTFSCDTSHGTMPRKRIAPRNSSKAG